MVENTEYTAFVRRAIRGLGRRAGTFPGDADALVLLRDLSLEVEKALDEAVAECHRHGWSYGEIAQRLGVTRQAVQKRWGGPIEQDPTEGDEDAGQAAD